MWAQTTKRIWINVSNPEIWNLLSTPHFLSTHECRTGPMYWHVNSGSQSTELFQLASSWSSSQQLPFLSSWVELLNSIWPQNHPPREYTLARNKRCAVQRISREHNNPFNLCTTYCHSKIAQPFQIFREPNPPLGTNRHLSIAKYEIEVLETFRKFLIFLNTIFIT